MEQHPQPPNNGPQNEHYDSDSDSSDDEGEKGPSSSHSHLRWLILFLSCWIMFGNYYAFDLPSSLNRLLRGWLAPENNESLFQYRLGLLYSVYSIPNVILPFFVGRALDRWGSRFILFILSMTVAMGQLLVAFGISFQPTTNLTLILMGRIIFGLGGESLAVAQSRLVTHWFVGKELALAIGLNLSIARIGTVTNNILSPIIAKRMGIPAAFWFGFGTCVMSCMCTVFTILLDQAYRPIIPKVSRSTIRCKEMTLDTNMKNHNSKDRSTSRRRKRPSYHFTFWILVIICFIFYGCMVPYNNVASDYLLKRYFKGDLVKANLAMSIPDTLAMFLIPLLGVFVDNRGRRVTSIIIGSILFIIGHATLAIGSGRLIALGALVVLGGGYSTLLCFWACVPHLARSSRHSTAYGLLTSACNLSVTLIPFVVASIAATDPSYQLVGLFFASLASIALILSLLLAFFNQRLLLGLDSRPTDPPSTCSIPFTFSFPLVNPPTTEQPLSPPLLNDSDNEPDCSLELRVMGDEKMIHSLDASQGTNSCDHSMLLLKFRTERRRKSRQGLLYPS